MLSRKNKCWNDIKSRVDNRDHEYFQQKAMNSPQTFSHFHHSGRFHFSQLESGSHDRKSPSYPTPAVISLCSRIFLLVSLVPNHPPPRGIKYQRTTYSSAGGEQLNVGTFGALSCVFSSSIPGLGFSRRLSDRPALRTTLSEAGALRCDEKMNIG